MMIAQLTPEMLKGIPMQLVGLGALLWITNEFFKLARNIRGKVPEPANEVLGVSSKNLSHRLHTVEGSIRKIYSLLDEIKNQTNAKFAELGVELSTAAERRTKDINEKFQEIGGMLARLDERTTTK